MKLERLSFIRAAAITLLGAFSPLLFSGAVSWGAETEDEKNPVASVSIGAELSSGKYNTATTTRTIYVPLIVSWYPSERIDMSLELPFIYQSSSSVTTSIYQNPAVVSSSQTVARNGGPGGIISNGSGASNGSGTGASGSSGYSSATSSLGDIILRAGYIQLFEKGAMPQVRTSLFVKAPTASVSAGLGTGEFDLGGGLDLNKWFGNMLLGGEVIFTYQGKVSDFGLNNYVSYSGTLGYQLTDTVRPMLSIKGATAPSSYSDDLLEVRGRLFWNITPTTNLDIYASRGISDSSPDYGGGVAVIYSF